MGDDQESYFQHVSFEMVISYPSKYVKQEFGYINMELNEETQVRDIHLVDESPRKGFKSMRLDKIIKEVSIKKEKRSKDEA